MAIEIPPQLRALAEGDGSDRTVTVRTLLSWFGAERRGLWKVKEIRKVLNKLKLRTEPDFEQTWIGAEITIVPKPTKTKPGAAAEENGEPKNSEAEVATEPTSKSAAELTSRIKINLLAAANKKPLTVAPDTDIVEATTLMMQNDYSQLPVITSEHSVKGVFSWKSLGHRQALGKKCTKVRECIDDWNEVQSDASLFDAIHQIVETDFVLVRDSTNKLVGIVTTADLSFHFAQLGEPFLLLGEIENHVRNLIADKFTKAELASALDPSDKGREIDDASDLSLGEYIHLLENPKNWEKLGLVIDRKAFCEQLKHIGRIRNSVMHFNPDGTAPEDLESVRKFARFLSDLERKLD
jgi:predicted transcriptional regulator